MCFSSTLVLTLAFCLDLKRAKKKSNPKEKQAQKIPSVGRFDALLAIPTPKQEDLDTAGLTPANDMRRIWSPPGEMHVLIPLPSKSKELRRLMPAWNKDFWRVYGNKVRVNGTIEGVCDFSSADSTNIGAQLSNSLNGIVLGNAMG